MTFSCLAACVMLSEGPGHADPPERELPPVGPDERMVTVEATASQAESRTVGVASEERPEMCFGTDQAAVVRVQSNDAGVRLPVWTCFDGCAPGFEFVTAVRTGRRRHGSGDLLYFGPACAPRCAPNEHRTTQLIEGTTSVASTCAPGAPSASARAATAREDDRRLRAVIALRKADLDAIAGFVRTAEQARAPWDDATLFVWKEAHERLGKVERGLPGWFRAAGVLAGVADNYRGESEAVAEAAREDFLARVRAGLPEDEQDVVSTLRARLERLRALAEDASQRHAAAAEQAERRRQAELEAASRARARLDCLGGCAGTYGRCLLACRRLTQAACAACDVDRGACVAKCDAAW